MNLKNYKMTTKEFEKYYYLLTFHLFAWVQSIRQILTEHIDSVDL